MRTAPTSGWLNRDLAITASMIAVVMIVGLVILAFEAKTEPYHIDELRQVSYYSQPLDGVIDSSFGMEQPPLDMIINSQVQRVIGVGDLRQRAVSISLGAASIGLMGILALLAGFGRWGAVATAAALAFSPTTISATAYARPYALPTFLMLAFLVVTIMWLRTGAIGWALVIVANAVLLLLSRPTEPYLFLLVVPGTLLLWQSVARGYRWPRVGYVAAASVGALVLVGRPILAEICQNVDQCRTVDVSVLSQVTRLWTDAPAAVVDALWYPAILLLATTVFFAVGRSRKLLTSQWWFWALVGTAATATAAFFVLSDPELGFSAKYTYLYFPIFSLMLGALVDATASGTRDHGLRSVEAVASGTMSILVFVALATSAWTLATTESRVDYAELAAMALAGAPDRTIITDSPRDLGRWRPWMYGRGRYYPSDAPFVRVDDVVYNPTILDTDTLASFLLIGVTSFDVPPPFVAFETPNGTLVLDPDAEPGPESVAGLLAAVGHTIGGNRGSTPSLAGAVVSLYAGDMASGCSEIERVSSDPAVPPDSLLAVLTDGWYADAGDLCGLVPESPPGS